MSGRGARHWIELVAVVAVIVGLAWLGVYVRQQTWVQTESLRYDADMQNGWRWGSRAAKEGFVGLYDKVAAEHPDHQDYGLDYLPLRLGAMTLWAKNALARQPGLNEWKADYAFNLPLLRFNTICEALTAIGIGLLVLDWVRRDAPPGRRWLWGVWPALIGAAVAWMNPASLISAHGRPTWDVWVTPFYVWAILAATRNGWFVAGCILGVGTLFKGQELFVVPLFLLWPMMRLRWGAVGRFVLGFMASVAVCTTPWLVGPKVWPIVFVLAVAYVPVGVWMLTLRWQVRGRSMPASWLRWLVPAALTLAILACVPLFGGSVNWLRIGLLYGAEKFKGLQFGDSAALTGILQSTYGWGENDLFMPAQSIWPGMTIAHLLIVVYSAGLLVTAWCASRLEKAGDRRFVLAVAAPWILYFAVFPRVHERYLLWGAVIASAGIAANAGTLMLGVFFSLCSFVMSMRQMASGALYKAFTEQTPSEPARTWLKYLNPTYPGLAWAVVLATLIWFWMMFAAGVTARKKAAKAAGDPTEIVKDGVPEPESVTTPQLQPALTA